MVEFEELVRVYEVLQDTVAITNQFDESAFTSFYCMLLEEWCRTHDEDIVDRIKLYAQMIRQVNETCGKY